MNRPSLDKYEPLVKPGGVLVVNSSMIQAARAAGERWKLVCTARRAGEHVVARVAPERVDSDSPFYSIRGTSSYVQFETDTLPGLGIVESDPSPRTTAYGLLADLVNALHHDHVPVVLRGHVGAPVAVEGEVVVGGQPGEKIRIYLVEELDTGGLAFFLAGLAQTAAHLHSIDAQQHGQGEHTNGWQ